jgi:hypothetical protein
MARVALIWDSVNRADLRNSLALKGYRVLGVIQEEDAAHTIREHRPQLIVHRGNQSACVASMVSKANLEKGNYSPQLSMLGEPTSAFLL